MNKNNFYLPTEPLLNLSLLGGFVARVDDKAILDSGYAKLRGLLALLAMSADTPLSREFLAEMLWPNMDSKIGRQNLRLALFNLKSSMDEAGYLLSSQRDFVTLSSQGLLFDVTEFVADAPVSILQMERQSDLYRGEFMSGFYLPDCHELDNWLLLQRETMQRRALSLLERLSDHYERTGHLQNAMQYALRSLELDSWNEHAHRRVMRLYALSGSSGAALAQFEMCCKLLKNEMGVLPSEETRQLAERIRNGAIELPDSFTHPTSTATFVRAERIRVTVLYCELSAVDIDDPEDAMALLHAPQARCMTIIQQFLGHIVQTHGGGLLAYFGYPQADERSASHSVQAALAVTRIASDNVKIRVAVHTGLIITSSDSTIPDTVGNTSKLAIQLRHYITHNEVVISRETQLLVDGYFNCVSLGEQPIPNTSGMLIFKVMGESGARTRLEAASHLTPFIGRQTELVELMKLWRKAEQGKVQVVLIKGEAGIGKSRLLHTLKQQLTEQEYEIRAIHCFPKYNQSPFYPIIELLSQVFSFSKEDSPSTKSNKLVRYIELRYPAMARNAIPLLCQLFSLPMAKEYVAPALSPHKLKEQILILLLDLMQALATQQATLLIVEDLHWCDPSTLALLSLFVEQNRKSYTLALFTARPEFVAPWESDLVNVLNLAPLNEEAMTQLITHVNAGMSPIIIRSIVKRADGVALYGEEMAKVAPLSHSEIIPPTLYDLLAARIDSLDSAKSTVQLASVIGREFDLNLLGRISQLDQASLVSILDELLAAGLIVNSGELSYQFKHALIQEAIYQSLIKAERQVAHKGIAQILQVDFPYLEISQPELLAQHLTAAGEVRRAIDYWLKAGQRATLCSANIEAIEHFNCGLQLLSELKIDDERHSLEIDLCLHLGTVLVAGKGFGSVEAGEVYARALDLSEQSGDQSSLYQALWGMWLTSSSRVGHGHSLELAEKLLRFAQQGDDVLQLQQAYYALGNSQFWTGDFDSGCFHLERSMALYHPSHHELMVTRFGENTCISSGAILMLVLWLQGYPDRAEVVRQRTLNLARQVNYPFNFAYALSNSAMLSRWMRQVELSEQFAQECMNISDQFGLPFWYGMGATSYGWAMVVRGQMSGVVQIQQCLDNVNTVMSGAKLLFLAPLCEGLIALGQYQEALKKLDEALAVVEEKNDRFFESEFHRLKGVCILEVFPSKIKEAEDCFNQALIISRQQDAKSLELRAAVNIAQLWQQQGKQKDAWRLLNQVYSWFSEGFVTKDLYDAASLLSVLSKESGSS
ncbi:MAG: AAA family ATPase [Oceanospirillaceae bacterium]|nr:AAA family ATPase [Oceanospirillaceae bacterium]